MQTQIQRIAMPEPGPARQPATEKAAARDADRVLHLVGRKWLLLVLRDVCEGRSRFNQLQASLGISRALLTARLRELVAEGIVETTRLPGSARRRQYVPTAKGLALYRIILLMREWETIHQHN